MQLIISRIVGGLLGTLTLTGCIQAVSPCVVTFTEELCAASW